MDESELLNRKFNKACEELANRLNSCPEGRDCVSGITKEHDCLKCWQIYFDIVVRRQMNEESRSQTLQE